MELFQNILDQMGTCLCIYIVLHSTKILALSYSLIPGGKVEGRAVLSRWVTLHTFLIPSGELPRNSAEADQNPKSLGGSGVDWEME